MAIKVVIALGVSFSPQIWAASGGYVYDFSGDVSVGEANGATHALSGKGLIPANALLNTGEKSYAILQFKDGQSATMQANTTFRVTANHNDATGAGSDGIVFTNFTGGMRINTARTGVSNQAFRILTPNATITANGAELLLVISNNILYSKVISGSISMINGAGTTEFITGATVIAASSNSLPAAIPAAALPPDIFSQFDAIPAPPAISATVYAAYTPATDNANSTALKDASTGAFPTKNSGSTPVQAYTVPNRLCDFCTSSPDKGIAHVVEPRVAGDPVTGESTLFGKHNLTPTGANTGEICAFCHTPQGAENNVAAPRWNRTLTTLSSYRAYSSLGSAVQEATGSISMACLSCHDGSQAPNIVINTPTLRLDVGDVQVNVGNTLRNHHPVGIQYAGGGQNQNAPDIPLNPIAAFERLDDANNFAGGNKFGGVYPRSRKARFFNSRDIYAFTDVLQASNEGNFDSTKGGFNKSTYSGTGSGTVWWVKTPGSKKGGRQKTDLYLFTRTDTIDSIPSESTLNRPYVECATCHDPHSTNSTFLRMPGGNERSQICLTCHNK